MNKISEPVLNFLINSAWQIAALALIAAVCARLLRNAAARYRHALWLAALVLSLALPLWGIIGFTEEEVTQQITMQRNGALQAQDKLVPTLNSMPAPDVTDATKGNGLTLDRLFRRHRQSVPTAPSLSLVFAIGYALFVLYRLGMLWLAWWQAMILRRSAFEREVPAPIAATAARCRNAFSLRSVPLLCSTSTTMPVTVGARQPVIILPESFYRERSEETLTSVLAHEMAHVARRDYARNIACELLCLPISFHPLAKYIRRQINKTRELACDEMVTERLLEPRIYARALVRVAGACVETAGQAFTLGIFDADILEERIMKLTRNTRRFSARAGRLLALAAFSLLCLSCLTISTFSFDLRSEGTSKAEALSAVATKEAANESGDVVSPQSQKRRTEPLAPAGQSNSAQTRAERTQQLSSNSPQERAQMACEAGKNHTVNAIPALIEMLGDDAQIPPLRCWENGRWNPALDSFKQPSPGEQAAIALASMGTPALEPLTHALGDANASVRRNAAWAIGELTNMDGDERDDAVAPLISLLNDSDEWVRMAAARALGEISDERATESLIVALADGAWRVRELAAWALSEMKEERAVEPLCRLLVSDVQMEVRRMAAEALGEIKSQRAVSSLNQALNDPEQRVRAKARWALSEIEDSDG